MSLFRPPMNLRIALCRLQGAGTYTYSFNTAPIRGIKVGPKGTYIAKMIPTMVKLQAGKKYSWCKCGLSKKQPFCDGSHKPTEMKPVRFEVEKSKSYLLCRCKQTSNEPFCDMTHVRMMFKSFAGQLKDEPIS